MENDSWEIFKYRKLTDFEKLLFVKTEMKELLIYSKRQQECIRIQNDEISILKSKIRELEAKLNAPEMSKHKLKEYESLKKANSNLLKENKKLRGYD